MRVLHIIAPSPYGGAEAVVSSLSSALLDAGHEVMIVSVITPTDGDFPSLQAFRETGAEIDLNALFGGGSMDIQVLEDGWRILVRARRASRATSG